MTHQPNQIDREALVVQKKGRAVEFLRRNAANAAEVLGGIALVTAGAVFITANGDSEAPLPSEVAIYGEPIPAVLALPDEEIPNTTLAPEMIVDITDPDAPELIVTPVLPEVVIEFIDLSDASSIEIGSIDLTSPVINLGELNGRERGAWGSAVGSFELGILRDHRFGLDMPGIGEQGTSFVIAHSNKLRSGDKSYGFNFIDDAEYPDDVSISKGDTSEVELEDGTSVALEAMDLREFIPENEDLQIKHLPNVAYEDGTVSENIGLYVPKSGFFDEDAAAEYLLTQVTELTDEESVMLLFTSYAGPNGGEWDENFAPGAHRKYHGIIAFKVTNLDQLHNFGEFAEDQIVDLR